MSAASVCILLGLVLFVAALATLPCAHEAGMSAAPGADKYGLLAPLGARLRWGWPASS
jgi:hypothetical protein